MKTEVLCDVTSEDEYKKLLGNFVGNLPDYTASHPRKE
jgi:hypothetical protein